MAIVGISSRALAVYDNRGSSSVKKPIDQKFTIPNQLSEQNRQPLNNQIARNVSQVPLSLQPLKTFPQPDVQKVLSTQSGSALQAYQSIASFQQTDHLSSILGIDIRI